MDIDWVVDVLGLGLVTNKGEFVFDETSRELIRIAPVGKVENKATDISSMFQWTGYVCDISLDANGGKRIDGLDASPADVAFFNLEEHSGNENGVMDDGAEIEAWLDTQVTAGKCEPFTDDNGLWVFDIAGLVVYGWDYVNNGSKLVQIRF